MIDRNVFLRAYIECALWSSTDNSREDGGDPLDANYGEDGIAEATHAQMKKDCDDFIDANEELLNKAHNVGSYSFCGQYSVSEMAGHDFWLTRNGHGAGFWDRGLGIVGEQLSNAARVYGSVDLYVGDDELIHSS